MDADADFSFADFSFRESQLNKSIAASWIKLFPNQAAYRIKHFYSS